MPSKTFKRTSKRTSISSKATKQRKPVLAYVRPMSGTLTEQEAEKIILQAGGKPATPAEKRKYAKFLKR